MTTEQTPDDALISKLARAVNDDAETRQARQWAVADLAGKTPAQIEQARRDGRLRDVMTGQAPDSTEYRTDHIHTVRKAK